MSSKSSRKADKTLLEFLPAAIEVEQTPASYQLDEIHVGNEVLLKNRVDVLVSAMAWQ